MIRYALPLLIILLVLLFLNTCSKNNFFPVDFEGGEAVNEYVTIDMGTVTTKNWKTNYISPKETHLYSAEIDSGFTYSLKFETECQLRLYPYLVIDDISDKLHLNWDDVHHFDLEASLFSTFKNSKLYLRILSGSSLWNQEYSILLKKENVDTVSVNSYLDTNILAIENKPVKSIFNDSINIDSVVFEHIDRKYLYSIPIDSFQMISLSLRAGHWHYPRTIFPFAIFSGDNDSIMIDSTYDDWFHWRYWKNTSDSLYLSVGVDCKSYDPLSKLDKMYGIFYKNLPQITVTVEKNSFPPVKKDPFYDDTSSMIYLQKDTLYQLSIYDEVSDKFYYTVNADSLYSLTISSIDSLPVDITLSPLSDDLKNLEITGEKDVLFRPVEGFNTLCIEIESGTIYPVNYSLLLSNYTGVDKSDTFEPDDDAKTASLLYEDSTSNHTIFPDNDVDLFKVYCLGNDTFKINIGFTDSTTLEAHKDFSLKPFYNFTPYEMKIHELSRVDSASFKIYTFFRVVADTAVFILKDKEYLSYSISLTR